MRRSIAVRRLVMEVTPVVAAFGLVGILLRIPEVRVLALVAPLGVILALVGSSIRSVRREPRERQAPLRAALFGMAAPVSWFLRHYWRLGLWRGRALYDLVALAAVLVGAAWWVGGWGQEPAWQNAAYWCALVSIVLFPLAAWCRMKHRRVAPALYTDVLMALEAWKHKRRRDCEVAYENAISRHLTVGGFDVQQGVRLDNGREADIVVRPKGRGGSWDYRDVMIEMKAHLTKQGEADRACGQVETYLREWPGSIVLMVCGDYRQDLADALQDKVESLCSAGRTVHFVLKGRPA